MIKYDETDAIWAGDESLVEALALQYSKRKSVLLAYASELYRFRRHAKYEVRLTGLAAELMGSVRGINSKSKKCKKISAQKYAEEANELAKVLEWLSRGFVPRFRSTHLLCAAVCVSSSGMRIVDRFPDVFVKHPTPARLKLTAAKIALNNGETAKAKLLMRDVEDTALVIDDACDRVRALREAGLVCRNNGMPIRGTFLAVRGLLVRGVPFDVHKKSLGAFVFTSLAA